MSPARRACGIAAVILLIAGCNTKPRMALITHGPCIPKDPGTPQALVRTASIPDTALVRSGEGALFVEVTGPDELPLDAQVRLFRGDSVREASVFWTTRTDSLGRWISTGHRPSPVYVQARALGYDSHGVAIELRRGLRDTVRLRLRHRVACPT